MASLASAAIRVRYAASSVERGWFRFAIGMQASSVERGWFRFAMEAGCNAVTSTLGVMSATARTYAHRIPTSSSSTTPI